MRHTDVTWQVSWLGAVSRARHAVAMGMRSCGSRPFHTPPQSSTPPNSLAPNHATDPLLPDQGCKSPCRHHPLWPRGRGLMV